VSRLGRALAIRSGEARVLVPLAALFAFIEAGRGLGEVGADTLLLSRIGASALPFLYVGLGLASLVVALGFGAAVGRLRMGPFFTVLLGCFAAVLTVLSAIAVGGGTTGIPALWLVVYVVGTIEGTLVWAMAGAVFDARQAKRLFPLCTSAAILGGFVGTLSSGPLARIIGTELLFLVDGVLVAAAALTAILLTRRAGSALVERPRALDIGAQLRSGYEYVRSSPLLRLVAVAYIAFSVLAFAVSYPFAKAMAAAFPSDADLATALGLLSAAVTATSFIVSVGVANRVFGRFGIASAALLLPLVYLAGFATWLVSFTLATAVAFRFAQQVTQRGLSNSAWTAFYNVVPRERRARVLAFMDGVPGQLGISLSGLLLIAAGALLAPSQVAWIGLVAAVVLIVVVLQVRRRYAETIVTTLRAGLAEQMLEGGPGLVALGRDPELISGLRRGLNDIDPGVRSLSAELLGRLGRSEALDDLLEAVADRDASVRAASIAAVGSLVHQGAIAAGGIGASSSPAERIAALVDDPEPAVRAATVRALAELDGAALADRCDTLAADPDPAVRAELAIALVERGEEERPHAILAGLLESPAPAERVAGLGAVARLGGHMPSPRLTESLGDPVPAVRAAAVSAVAAIDPLPDRVPLLAAALDDEAAIVRRAGSAGLAAHFDESRETILETLRTGPPRAQEAALEALDGHGPDVRTALIAWSTVQVSRADTLRRASRSLDADGTELEDGSVAFLGSILRRREWQIEERLLTAVALAGAGDISGLLRRCLRSDDSDVRAQAIEAIDSLGDRGLGRALVRLLESDDDGRPRPEAEVLHELAGDADPWVRALAVRALSRSLEREWRAVVDSAREDPEPLVRSMVATAEQAGGTSMPETRATLGEIDRMLFLRRVPLFSELAPEDLHRIAATTSERVYPADEPIVREGDLGDELVVIVEGGVRVVRGGDERPIRTYAAGDHFGELAVLRDRPRAATVIADPPGVRGLVIDGAGLRAILRERPEAAMAMLATLAERISSQ
jgi:ATP/ADP translocase/HEAT repeat protein